MRYLQDSKSHKKRLAVLITMVAVVLMGGRSVRAQSIDNDGCSNATLAGDYAFTVSGKIFLPTGIVVEREGIAMTHFDGGGNLTQVDFVLSSPNAGPPPGSAPVDPITGFHTQETGTYSVYSDCTGTFTIHFPPFTTSAGGSISGAIIVVKFALSNGGRSIHTVVVSLTPPGGSGPIPALIRSEGRKLQPVLQPVREN
jgi:hypothetical protein